MRIDILSVVPELLRSPFEASILKRAQDAKCVEIHLHNIRDYSANKYKQVDDYPYGGGAGMVLMIEPIAKCIEALQSEREYDAIVYMTPDGQQLNQKIANRCSLFKNMIVLCGHYKGVDQRVRDLFVTDEISIGDYVLSGGELAAAVFCDAIIRLIPGVLGNESSALTDSFQDNLLAPPIYTRPADYNGHKVPNILTSGNTPKVEQWREQQAVERTKKISSRFIIKHMNKISTFYFKFLFTIIPILSFGQVISPTNPYTKNFVSTTMGSSGLVRQSAVQQEPKLLDIESAFDAYWQGKDYTEKGSGYKPFKRWAHHWQDYLQEDGTIAPPAALWQAWERKQDAESQQAPFGVPDENTINWSNLGPAVVTNSSVSTSGQGRVNTIIKDPNNDQTLYVGAPRRGDLEING